MSRSKHKGRCGRDCGVCPHPDPARRAKAKRKFLAAIKVFVQEHRDLLLRLNDEHKK